MQGVVLLMLYCLLLSAGVATFQGSVDDDEAQTTARSNANQVISSDYRKKKAGEQIVKRTINSAKSDSCDWRTNPLAAIRGQVCGSHYKVLGLNRKRDVIDKNAVRKAYRQMSLAVHPDKNPSADADVAFQLIQEAYECLSDDGCRENFDSVIELKEQKLKLRRIEIKQMIVDNVRKVAVTTYHHAWNLAHQIHDGVITLWDWAGDITIRVADNEVPIGRGVLAMSLLSRIGRVVFMLHLMSSLFMKFDEKGNQFLDM